MGALKDENWVPVYAAEDCVLPGGPPIAVHRVEERWKRTGRLCSLTAQGPPPKGSSYDSEKTRHVAFLIAAAPALLRAAKLVQPAMASLMDELGKRLATNWGLVNDCLVEIGRAIKLAEEGPPE